MIPWEYLAATLYAVFKKNTWKTMTFTLECLFSAALPDLLPNLP